MKKTLLLFAIVAVTTAVFAQDRSGSRFFQSTSVRICKGPDQAPDCRDIVDNTIWEVTNDLEYVKMISDDGTSTMYAMNVHSEEGTSKFLFECRDLETNMIYDLLIDFQTKTIFLIDHSDNTRFLFYWSKQWETKY